MGTKRESRSPRVPACESSSFRICPHNSAEAEADSSSKPGFKLQKLFPSCVLWLCRFRAHLNMSEEHEVLVSVCCGWPLLEQSPGLGGRCIILVIILFCLALGLECTAGPGNDLRKINILVLFLIGTNKDKSCLRSSRGHL